MYLHELARHTTGHRCIARLLSLLAGGDGRLHCRSFGLVFYRPLISQQVLELVARQAVRKVKAQFFVQRLSFLQSLALKGKHLFFGAPCRENGGRVSKNRL